MKRLHLAALAAGIAAVVALVGVGRIQSASGDTAPATADRSITVTGNGSVAAVPNKVTLSFGVTTQAKTAAAALSANSDEMTKVIEALKDAGVAGADIQTSSVSLSPTTSQDGTQIVGYAASNSVSATIGDVGKAGALVDAAVAAGANQVSGPFLSVSDTNGLYRAALKQAVADAKAKAQALADASGLTLGAVRSVVESGGATPPQPYAAAEKTAAPIEPGTQEITASATVVFEVS
jgi:uncharacterized protein YggE